jgi:hypothetical protein
MRGIGCRGIEMRGSVASCLLGLGLLILLSWIGITLLCLDVFVINGEGLIYLGLECIIILDTIKQLDFQYTRR